MFIDGINLNLLRIFTVVFQTKSMTLAAKQLHLTQSGISQHIKSLEDALGKKLFDRVQQRLVPTAFAAEFFKKVSNALTLLESAVADTKSTPKELTGKVVLGMPIEFGINILMPLLSDFSKKHPGVDFKMYFDFASAQNEMILKGDVDFAFVDEFSMDRRIVVENVYDEHLELVMTEELYEKLGSPKPTKEFFESLDYIEYQDEQPMLKMWFGHHLKDRNLKLHAKATLFDVQGIARLICSGAGAGLLPTHVVEKLRKEGNQLHLFKGSGKPLTNRISVAYLRERTQTAAAIATLEFLKAELKKSDRAHAH